MTQLQLVAKLFHRDAARLAALEEARGDLYYYDKAELRPLKTDFDTALAALVDQPVKIVALDAAPEPCACEAVRAAAPEPAGPPPPAYGRGGGFGRGRGAGAKGAKGGKGKGTMGKGGKGGTGGKGGGADPEAARAFAAAWAASRAVDGATDGGAWLVKSNGVPEYQPRKIQGGAVVEGAWQGATRNGRYDRNPNAIVAQDYAFSIPLTPGPPLAAPLATPMGAIGVAVNGVPLYNQYGSPEGGDAVEDESFDACCGHPDGLGRYRMFPASLASVPFANAIPPQRAKAEHLKI
ncbi:hypothetical protein JL721_3074 [Aureococcus anophagefferens]|nr:hypothetical protein JL721_3074 [Aureococcus anophagefferens]